MYAGLARGPPMGASVAACWATVELKAARKRTLKEICLQTFIDSTGIVGAPESSQTSTDNPKSKQKAHSRALLQAGMSLV
jgi:hypothetical protein